MESENPELNSLIERFIALELPDDQHQQLQKRLANDPVFESKVLAHWMLRTYVQDQRHKIALYHNLHTIAAAAGRRQPRNRKLTPVFLFQLIGMAAAILVCTWVGTRVYLYSHPPVGRTCTVAVTDGPADEYGFSNGLDSVRIVQYDRHFSFWDLTDTYVWTGKVLSIYSPELAHLSTQSWQISTTERQNVFRLRTQQHTYTLYWNQRSPAPLNNDDRTP